MKHLWLSWLEILIGTILCACAFSLFILPQSFAAGGATGLSMILVNYLPFSLSTILFAVNSVLFLFGLVFLGISFAAKTAIVSFAFPVLLGLFSAIDFSSASSDPFLSAVLAGLLLGIGSGLVLRGNGSNGGFDIPGMIAKKYFNLPPALIMYCLDLVVILYHAMNIPVMNTIYGLVVIMVSNISVTEVLAYGRNEAKIMIFSRKYEDIRPVILHDLDEGMTYLNGVTGYEQKETKVIVTVVPYNKINPVKKAVLNIDPEAFVVVENVRSVLGRGYTMELRS